jgi:hypothetical protein
MACSAFGLSLSFEPQPPGAWRSAPEGGPAVAVRLAPIEEVEGRWSGGGEIGWEANIDGALFVVESGRAGDHRFTHGEGLTGHLSASGSELLCSVVDRSDLLAWRVILDSVLFSVALLAGFEALHAGAVVTKAGVVAITAGPGGGKSTLLAELIAGGAELLSDDVVVLEAQGGATPLAHPGPPLMTVPDAVGEVPGELIAPIGGEQWVATQVASEPLALAGLVVLDRGPGRSARMERVDEPLAALLGSLLRFPRNPERDRSRFEIAAAIASNVPVWKLGAEPDVPPDELARLLRSRLDE